MSAATETSKSSEPLPWRTLGQQLQFLRVTRRLSFAQAAAEARVPIRLLNELEIDRLKDVMEVATIVPKLATLYDTPVEDLLILAPRWQHLWLLRCLQKLSVDEVASALGSQNVYDYITPLEDRKDIGPKVNVAANWFDMLLSVYRVTQPARLLLHAKAGFTPLTPELLEKPNRNVQLGKASPDNQVRRRLLRKKPEG